MKNCHRMPPRSVIRDACDVFAIASVAHVQKRKTHVPKDLILEAAELIVSMHNASLRDGSQRWNVGDIDALLREKSAPAMRALAILQEIRKWMDGEIMGAWDAKFVAEIDAVLAEAGLKVAEEGKDKT